MIGVTRRGMEDRLISKGGMGLDTQGCTWYGISERLCSAAQTEQVV